MTRDEALKIKQTILSFVWAKLKSTPLNQAKDFLEGYEQGVRDSAKFIKENGWNDTTTMVNQHRQALAYALTIENALLEVKS
jgi:hypothetical protein